MLNIFRPLLLFAASFALLSAFGCNSTQPASTQTPAALSGNWAFTVPATQAVPSALTLNAGFTPGPEQTVNAVAHLTGASCVSAGTGIVLSGSVAPNNMVALKSQPFGGSTLSLKGQLATSGKTISGASLTFSGGSCASLGSAQADATNYAQIDGTYTGTFVDAGNNQLAISATLTQTTQPDQNGQYQLSGSATFPDNPCFTQPIVTNSLVTGSSLSTTYTEGSASITAQGTFNSTATVLTVTNWQVTGGLCDGDSGTGVLTAGDQ
jgi:hypothetical protein